MKRQSDDRALTTLMQAAQAGDAQAYVRLLKEITPRLRHIVRRQRCFVKAEDIEDLVQDILLSLHAVRASYDPQRPFMPWLMAITRNRLVDGARRYSRRAAREVQLENVPVTFSDEGANIDSDEYRDPEALRGDRGSFARATGRHRDIEITRNVAERSRRCEGDEHWGT
jgi:RNA polymerase sigma factor (sigma-70 family)